MFHPSFIAHGINGILMGIGGIAGSIWLYNNPLNFSPELLQAFIILFILILSIIVGIHGISHALLESQYGWDPLRNLFGSRKTFLHV